SKLARTPLALSEAMVMRRQLGLGTVQLLCSVRDLPTEKVLWHAQQMIKFVESGSENLGDLQEVHRRCSTLALYDLLTNPGDSGYAAKWQEYAKHLHLELSQRISSRVGLREMVNCNYSIAIRTIFLSSTLRTLWRAFE